MDKTEILYHGSNRLVRTPKIVNRNNDVDFGPGFYTTKNEKQASSWARIKAASDYGVPILNVYRYEPDQNMKILKFGNRDENWLDFVYQSRFLKTPHDYDIVRGYCIQGTALCKMKLAVKLGFKPNFADLAKYAVSECTCEQTVFCSEPSFTTLTFLEEQSRSLESKKNFSQIAPIEYSQEAIEIIRELIQMTISTVAEQLVIKYHLSEKFFLEWLYQSHVYAKLIDIPLEYWGLADEDIVADVEHELIGE